MRRPLALGITVILFALLTGGCTPSTPPPPESSPAERLQVATQGIQNSPNLTPDQKKKMIDDIKKHPPM